MNLDYLYPSVIGIVDDIISYEDNEKIKQFCLDHEEQYSYNTLEFYKGWRCNVQTTIETLYIFHEDWRDTFSSLEAAIRLQIAEYAKLHGTLIPPDLIFIRDGWYNISHQYQYQESHIHAKSDISGIYYVKGDETSADTIFQSPYDNLRGDWSGKVHSDIKTGMPFNYPVKERRLMLFPSYLPHLTAQQLTTDPRITISFNCQVQSQ